MDALRSLAASPDGKNVYGVSMDGSAVLVYDRDPATGALSQPETIEGCFTWDGNGDGWPGICTPANGIGKMRSVTVSPDGKNVYATAVDPPDPNTFSFGIKGLPSFGSKASSAGALLTFKRLADGDLQQLVDSAGCVVDSGEVEFAPSGCGFAKGIPHPNAVRVSPDGKNVYVVGNDPVVAVFSRDTTADGALTQLSGADATANLNLDEPLDVVVSPDNANVYVVLSEGTTNERAPARNGTHGAFTLYHGRGGIVEFSRELVDTTRFGALTKIGCIQQDVTSCDQTASGLSDAITGAIAPNGLSFYVAAQGTRSPTPPGTLSHFARNASTGLLTFKSCISNDGTDGADSGAPVGSCDTTRNTVAMSEPTALTVAPDGNNLYVAAGDRPDGLAVFSIAADGTPNQLALPDGCVNEDGSKGCTEGRAVHDSNAVVMSPDCANVYAGSQDAFSVTAFAVNHSCLPTSKADVPACTQSGAIPVVVTDTTGGTGAKTLHYRIDGGPEQTIQTTATNPGTATITVPEGKHTLEYWAGDESGRVEDPHHSTPVTVDHTPPLVTIVSDQGKDTYAANENASITTKASDENSGLATDPSAAGEAIPTNSAGKHTVSKTAVDKCANTTTATFSYTVGAQLVLGAKTGKLHLAVTPKTAVVGQPASFGFIVFTNGAGSAAIGKAHFSRVIAVTGATVTFNGRRTRSDGLGRAPIRTTLTKVKRYSATARKLGYGSASASVRGVAVKKPRFTG
jgi:DNA-binding beta-propeller fold protein YncE